MPTLWPLRHDRPCIQVVLPRPKRSVVRRLLADSGAGSRSSIVQLVLRERDCVPAVNELIGEVTLGGSYSGTYPVYLVEVRIPFLNFSDFVTVAGVSHVPDGFDGIACFKFLNRFHYGNFGDADIFGLE
jgi:hypothetical protein